MILKLFHVEKPFQALLSGLLPLPWWWILPGLLGLLGGTSAGLAVAPTLWVLTWPLLGVTLLMLGRGWYLELSHRGRWHSTWRRRASLVLVGFTVLSGVLWGLRFAGLLGMRPF